MTSIDVDVYVCVCVCVFVCVSVFLLCLCNEWQVREEYAKGGAGGGTSMREGGTSMRYLNLLASSREDLPRPEAQCVDALTHAAGAQGTERGGFILRGDVADIKACEDLARALLHRCS